MKSANQIIKTIDYRQKVKEKTIDYSTNKISIEDADSIINSIAHLIDNNDYRPYFYKKLYACGAGMFLSIAKRAEEGKTPSRLFVALLKAYCK